MLFSKTNLDKAGMTVSWLCAFHCLMMPFLISMFPVIGLSLIADERIEWLLIGTSFLIGMVSLLPTYFRQHKKIRTITLFVFGIVFLILAHEMFEDKNYYQIPTLILGAIMITSAHFINRRLCLSCSVCEE